MMRRPRSPLAVAPRRRSAQAVSPLAPGIVSPVSRDAGAFRGQLTNYRPYRVQHLTAQQERATASMRSEDLVANDWAARSMVETITLNAIGGVGLTPQANIPAELLGLDEETARTIGNRMESWWSIWCEEAGFIPGQTMADLQFTGLRSVLVHGDMVHVPVMLDTATTGGAFSLRLQTIHPERMRTPADKRSEATLRDGVELDGLGRPAFGWIADPTPAMWTGLQSWESLGSANFRRLPYRLAHRVGLFHCYRPSGEEQFRGEPVITPALKLFRTLADSLDYELIAQIITASFPLFIKTDAGKQEMADYLTALQPQEAQQSREQVYYQGYAPGQVMYGNANEDAKPIVADRPGASWMGFVTFIVRAMGAVAGIPYEALLKDFSKTNYSSARAALLEAWRVYMLWRQWMARAYCQPLYRMVIEEAILRGYVTLPASAPGFYDALPLWTAAMWVGPGRGYIDPVKEVEANIMAVNNGFTSYSEVLAERGLSVEEVWSTRGHEDKLMQRLAPNLAATIAGNRQGAASPATYPSDEPAQPADQQPAGENAHAL